MTTPVSSSGPRPVSLVILGANFGAKIARTLASERAWIHLAGVCDLNADKCTQLATELGVKAYADLDAVLADPAIEAVGVFTGPAGRGRLLQRILATGHHVVTTKPFELDADEAVLAIHEASRRGLALYLNSPSPVPAADLACMQGWLRQRDLGRPVALQARTWADYRESADGSWLDDPARCPAAPLFRLGVYFLNDFTALLGRPLEVYVQQSRVRTGRPTADNAQISITFEGGALAHVFASFCVGDGRPYADEVTVSCERGTIRRWVERTGSTDMSGDHAVVELQRPGAAVERLTTKPGDFAGWYDWRAFHAAVRRQPGSVLLDGEGILHGVRLLAALARSSASGKPEAV